MIEAHLGPISIMDGKMTFAKDDTVTVEGTRISIGGKNIIIDRKVRKGTFEVIADFRKDSACDDFTATRISVLNTIRRRPCSVEDIAGGLGVHRNEAIKYIEELLARGLIEKTTSGGMVYYRCP
ncbi:MAG: winged helix-turn-helix domain-containing protein [Spirochaetes bacterium]|jgi:hypothetical protein|nr:winged helix-turn-helix domain-containing protein [Spirochaetota bacterium]